MQGYSDPSRESDPYALPDVEVFQVDERGYCGGEPFVLPHEPGDVAEGLAEPAWYWWPCFPGCMPDGDPHGPFATEEEALEDAQDY